MAYEQQTFIAGEQPSADKWNKLNANDDSFHDGTGIADNAIIARHLDLITRSGWLPLTAITRTADTTVTIVGDWTDRIRKGAKIRWLSDGSLRQNYVAATPTYSAGTRLTTITITAGWQDSVGDSIFANGAVITVPQYSLTDNPVGFNHWFNFAPNRAVSGGTAPTYTALDYSRFMVSGGVMKIFLEWWNNTGGTAGAGDNAITIVPPVVVSQPTGHTCMGLGKINGDTMNAGAGFKISSSTILSLYDWTGGGVFITGAGQNADYRHIRGTVDIEI